jgi:hypothetical protein
MAGTGGAGATIWSTASTLPPGAGQGGSFGTTYSFGSGGNAGLVILTYVDPTGTCPL